MEIEQFSRCARLLFISFFLLMLQSYRSDSFKDRNISTDLLKLNDSIQKKIRIPDTLEVYAPFQKYWMDSTAIAQAHSLKIYSYVNVSCPSCIGGIEEWDRLVPRFMEYNVPVILVCYSKDNFELIKYLCEIGQVKKFAFPFYLDIKNKFIQLNPVFREYRTDETLLSDGDNTILLTGNPIHSESTLELYMAEIKKKMNANRK